MALPSVVTLGSLVFVVAAGVGYAVTAEAAPVSTAAPTGNSHVSHVRTLAPTAPGAKSAKPIPGRQGASDRTTKARPGRDVVPNVLVAVYNNTAITGLAAQKAALLDGAGWHVAATGNWYGNIAADTVYYPPSMRPAAVKLAKVLHVTRIRPAVAPMQFDRLSVILATG